MTTSKAMVELKLLSDYHLYHSLDSEQIKAIDKAIEVMGRQGDSYWAVRCTLAGDYIDKTPCDPDLYEDQLEAYRKWIDYKERGEQ